MAVHGTGYSHMKRKPLVVQSLAPEELCHGLCERALGRELPSSVFARTGSGKARDPKLLSVARVGMNLPSDGSFSFYLCGQHASNCEIDGRLFY